MRARLRLGPATAIALATLALGLSGASGAAPAAAQGVASAAPAHPSSESTGADWLSLAQKGVTMAQQWLNPQLGFYDAELSDTQQYPLATIWDAAPLFETLDAIDLAAPSAAHRAQVVQFADYAEKFVDHALSPLGFAPYPNDRAPNVEVWMDDNAWWGIAFDDAYRATGMTRYLDDAELAMRYVAATGWDPSGGGLWWNTGHPYKSGPALAGNAALAAVLYQQTHSALALETAQRYLSWGDANMVIKGGLWATSSSDSDPGDYIEGAMIYAREVLCQAGVTAWCGSVASLAAAALSRFGLQAPQYDAIYARFMLALATATGDPTWAAPALRFGADAAGNATDSHGLWLDAWSGGSLGSQVTHPLMLQTQTATSELYAWLAVYDKG